MENFLQSPTNQIARLEYLKWDPKFDLVYGTEKPYEMNMQRPEGFPRTNMETELGPEEVIHDIRASHCPFSLDEHGFAYRRNPMEVANWEKLDVERDYLPSIERMLQAEFGDNAVIKVFQWRVCSGVSSQITSFDNLRCGRAINRKWDSMWARSCT
jgi:hypothetical protein